MHPVVKDKCVVFQVQADGADEGCVTFVMHDEDHTLGNSLRYMVMKKSVVLCPLFNISPFLTQQVHQNQANMLMSHVQYLKFKHNWFRVFSYSYQVILRSQVRNELSSANEGPILGVSFSVSESQIVKPKETTRMLKKPLMIIIKISASILSCFLSVRMQSFVAIRSPILLKTRSTSAFRQEVRDGS